MVGAMPSVTEDEAKVVPALRQCSRHAKIARKPVPLRAVPTEVSMTGLKEDLDRLPRRCRDKRRVRIPARHLRETRQESNDLSEAIGTQPRRGECCVATAAPAADHPVSRGAADRPPLLDSRQHFVEQEGHIPVIKGVVLDVAVLTLVWILDLEKDARIDKNTDRGWKMAGVHEIVERHRRVHLAVWIEVPPAVLKNNDRRWRGIVVAGRDMHPDASFRPWVDLAGAELKLDRLTNGGVGQPLGPWTVFVPHVGLIDRQGPVRKHLHHASDPMASRVPLLRYFSSVTFIPQRGAATSGEMPAFAGVTVFHDGLVLLIQQKDYFNAQELVWSFPSGRIEAGERPAEAAARELLEETGCQVDGSDLELVSTVVNSHHGIELSRSWNFAATSARADLKPDDGTGGEVLAAEWMTVERAISVLERNGYDPIRKPALQFLRTGRHGTHWRFELIDTTQIPPQFTWASEA